MVAEPAVALEMEVLPVVVGQAVGLGAGRQLGLELAMATGIDAGQVAEVEQAAAQDLGRLGADGARGREEAGFDVVPFAREQGTDVLRHLGPARRWPDREVGLGHRLEQPPARRIVAGVPGHPGRLAGRIAEAI